MARHEPADTFELPRYSMPGDGSVGDDGDAPTAPADRFASAKPAAPTWKGFSASGMAASAVAVAMLAVTLFVILAALDQPGLGLLFMLSVLVCAGTLYVLSLRRRARDQVLESLAEAMVKPIGVPSDAYLEIDARQWRGGWVGIPHVLNIQYPTQVDDAGPDWPAGVAAAVQAELDHRYVVGRHNVRARRVTLRDPKRSSGQLTPEPAARVARGREAARHALPDHVDHPVPTATDLASWFIPLGVDASGTRMAWDLAAPQGHLLVLGRSGSGKRVLLTGVVVELAARGWPVWIIDHRRVDLVGVRDWPNVQIVTSTLDDQIVVLNQAWREMESRVRMVESGSSPAELEPLVVVIHHVREFAAAVSDAADRAGHGRSSLATDRVTDLLRHGRQVSVFLVLSVQRAEDPLLSGESRDEFGAVVALGRLDTATTSALWGPVRKPSGRADGLEPAEPVPGRGMIQLGDGRPVVAQCYWTPDPREARRVGDDRGLRLLEALRPTTLTQPVLHVQRPRTLTDSPDAAWRATMNADLAEGYAGSSASLADWSRMPSPSPVSPERKDAAGWSELIMVSQLRPGHLARLDDTTGWVIVEQVEPVENDGTRLRIAWRGVAGTGSDVVVRTRTIRIRHMNDGVY